MCTRCCGEMASTLRSFTHTIRAGATTTIFRCCRRRRSSSAGELVAEEERTRSLGSEKNKGSVSKKSSGSSRSVSSGGSGRFRSKSPSPLSVDSSGNDKEEVAEKRSELLGQMFTFCNTVSLETSVLKEWGQVQVSLIQTRDGKLPAFAGFPSFFMVPGIVLEIRLNLEGNVLCKNVHYSREFLTPCAPAAVMFAI